MKQHQLHAFLALAAGGSLTRAASALNRTTAAISKSIRELESEFEVQLFERTPHGMSLSAGGRAFLPRAQAVSAEMTRAHEELGALRGQHAGHLRIGLTPAVSVLIAPDLVARFMQQHPAVRVELYEYQREQMMHRLDDGTLDVALHAQPSFADTQPDSRSQLVFETSFALVTARGGRYAQARALGDLQDALWIYTDPNGAQQRFVNRVFVDAGLDAPSRTLMCTASVPGVALAVKMDALMLVARPILRTRTELVALPLFPVLPELRVWCTVRHAATAPAQVGAFLEEALRWQARDTSD
ncbi:LysR family transcriptional regulator [Paraburkholderia flagellata]|uniref:LysR family transcriptional regulator n=1 Tax=Paraburkholderia flagellata TaxID=2883241 RepID=UPI001F489F7A|nr:LysR substrate-binding domain-containing protein [Paraburkholderia flagellata]